MSTIIIALMMTMTNIIDLFSIMMVDAKHTIFYPPPPPPPNFSHRNNFVKMISTKVTKTIFINSSNLYSFRAIFSSLGSPSQWDSQPVLITLR